MKASDYLELEECKLCLEAYSAVGTAQLTTATNASNHYAEFNFTN